jgi:hypothetical protein
VSAGATDVRRRWLTVSWLALGIGLAAAGLALSFRVGTEPFLDPILPASPVMFIAGLMVLVTTGAVYELLPERRYRHGKTTAG